MEYLLLAGASIQARDDGGLHPLHNACSFGHSDVVRLLLEAGANPNTRDNWNYTPLHEAAIKVSKITLHHTDQTSKYVLRSCHASLNTKRQKKLSFSISTRVNIRL